MVCCPPGLLLLTEFHEHPPVQGMAAQSRPFVPAWFNAFRAILNPDDFVMSSFSVSLTTLQSGGACLPIVESGSQQYSIMVLCARKLAVVFGVLGFIESRLFGPIGVNSAGSIVGCFHLISLDLASSSEIPSLKGSGSLL